MRYLDVDGLRPFIPIEGTEPIIQPKTEILGRTSDGKPIVHVFVAAEKSLIFAVEINPDTLVGKQAREIWSK